MAGAVFMAGAVQLFTADSAIAQQNPSCDFVSDFVTGGGFIVFTNGEHGNFGVAGGCKKDGSFFGHLEYVDHGSGIASSLSLPTPFNVHWMSITAYRFTDATTREICGTARTNDNDSTHSTVGFHVTVQDNDVLGPDTFRIQLFVANTPFYDTLLNPLGGGNIEIHKFPPPPPTDNGKCPFDNQ